MYERHAADESFVGTSDGTGLMRRGLHARLDPQLTRHVQIFTDRADSIDPQRLPVLWVHNIPNREDYGFLEHAEDRKVFAGIVCVSHFQAAMFNVSPGIRYDEMTVLQNAIEPFGAYQPRSGGRIRLVYHTTPHRGLDILVPVFEHLAQFHPDIELDVFSSFRTYGWPDTDRLFEPLFERCRAHPRIRYHGAQPNAIVRATLAESDIFAYPCVHPETSCIAAIEAMSAGCLTVCSAFACMPETCANFARLYPFTEDRQTHANRFAAVLDDAIRRVRQRTAEDARRRAQQADYFNDFYAWDRRIAEWDAYLRGVLAQHGRAVS